MSQAARAIYDQLSTEADIERFIAVYEAEKLHIDFKEIRSGTEVEKMLGAIVSGFANADGGVIVLASAIVASWPRYSRSASSTNE